METFDTNVVVRILVDDDPIQSALALSNWRRALDEHGVFLSKLVLAEAVWVLRTSYGFDRATIASTLGVFLNTQGLTIEDESQVRAALSGYATSGADLSDHLILETARVADALPVRSFDQRFARLDGVSQLLDSAP
jgi:predicted nucleic-acid-binding protein